MLKFLDVLLVSFEYVFWCFFGGFVGCMVLSGLDNCFSVLVLGPWKTAKLMDLGKTECVLGELFGGSSDALDTAWVVVLSILVFLFGPHFLSNIKLSGKNQQRRKQHETSRCCILPCPKKATEEEPADTSTTL